MKKKNMLRLFLLIGILFYTRIIFAQTVQVVDYESKTPVPFANVFNSRKNIYLHTDKKGLVNLHVFHLKDTIYFAHPDYEITVITKENIIKNKYRVELYRSATTLNTIVLSVSRTAQKKKDIAREVSVFDQPAIQKHVASEVPDILETAPGISVQKSQGGAGSPVIRGMEANRILLVIDGIRLNNAIYRAAHLHNSITVSPAVLERMEIIAGPSAIYGSDALGGVIHFITKTPMINSHKKIGGAVLGRFATATGETSFNFNLSFSQPYWASLTSVSYSDFGNIRMGTLRLHGYKDWGIVEYFSDNNEHYYNDVERENPDLSVQPNTGYKQYDFFNKTVVQTGPNATLTFDTQYHTTSNIPRFDKLTETKNGHLKFAEWYYGPMERFLFSPQWEWSPGRKWLDNLKIIPAYQQIHESRIKRKFGSLIRNYQKETVHVFSLNLDASAKMKRHTKFNYGAEVTYNRVFSKAYGKKLVVNGHRITGLEGDYYYPTRYPNDGSDYFSAALYGNWKHRFSRRHLLDIGVRFTQIAMNAQWKNLQLVALPFQIVHLANFSVTPNISYIFSPGTWKLSATFSNGFRSPDIDDIGKIREKKGKLLVPNIHLKPEYSYNSELGIGKKFFDNKIKINTFWYYNIIRNLIDRQPYMLNGFSQINYDGEMVDIYANVNNGNAFIYGTDWIFSWKINDLFLWNANFSYVKGRKQNGQPLPSIPPVKVYSSLHYKTDYFEGILSYEYNGRKPLNEYDVNGGIDNLDESPKDPATGEYAGFPSWQIFNFYFNYYLTHNLTLNIGVENIFDVHYKRFASAISAPGRNFKIQITGKF